MTAFTRKRFDLVWLGEIREDGTEEHGHTIASSKTLEGVRGYARMKRITDADHRIDEIGGETISSLPFQIETATKEHKINPNG